MYLKSKKIIAVLSVSFALTNFVGCTPKTDISYDDDDSVIIILSNSEIASSFETMDIACGNINITAQDDRINAIAELVTNVMYTSVQGVSLIPSHH